MPRPATAPPEQPPPAKRAAKYAACLCLLCRQAGHVLQSCPSLLQGKRQHKNSGLKLPDELEVARLSAVFNSSSSSAAAPSTNPMCQRCKNMDIFTAFTNSIPFTLDDKDPDHANRAKRKILQIRAMGPVLTLQLLSTCPLCCLIFNITYLTEDDLLDVTNPISGSKGQLVLVPAWTVNRLERDLQWSGYAKGEGPFARCLYTTVRQSPDEAYARTILVDWAMDAIGVEEGSGKGVPALGLKKVDPRTPDYNMISGWLRRCDDLHHATCKPALSDGLRAIKLVDVETRKIIDYPPVRCDYIALSYVWGGVVQPSYKAGDILPAVPATIEDAMVVTRSLGKRYLWVDSLCIDQANLEEKLVQIGLMSAIYSGAWATIICMSGQSAQSGLPRVGALEDIIPQLACEIDGRKMLATMPTLSRQISQSPWVKRAWTFQEGLLSPRRLFFTRHQVYFECNSVQCCESLDDSSSSFHCKSDDQRQASLDELRRAVSNNPYDTEMIPERILGRGVLRDPFRPFPKKDEQNEDEEDTFMKYMKLVYTYTSKKMTSDGDAIHAFSAVLTRLTETDYQRGFVQGLPVEDLPRALLWTHVGQSRRRIGFPAWSWAGWEGWVKPIFVKGARYVQRAKEPPLRLWRAGTDGHPELIYDFNPIQWVSEDPEELDEKGNGTGEEGESRDDGLGTSDVSGEEAEDSSSDEKDSNKSLDFASSWLHDRSSDEEVEKPTRRAYRAPRKVRGADTVLELARAMLDSEEPLIPAAKVDPNVLLVDGIIIRLTFKKARPQSCPDSDAEAEPHDIDENLKAHSERCLVELPGSSAKHELRFYGSNAIKVINKRNGKAQDFLLLAREDLYDEGGLWNALLLIDWDGDTASRVAVGSLGIDDPGLLASANAHRRFFKLR
ncbi:hypothetical protein HYDPIDRAFT_28536 [Hydnomerulius pinastri MD-312]|uniref:Heterokaryon incompatibility domain-containing protein n=1 Tax=Hydnomerulius pinastri MD-312 TaxID=994086 RepID=A0A0C9WG06_9AGAM|nr:hypothetical protein HYDPIDRAFT_28536 [Hydnomerulius pinastri MD-312]